MDCCLLAIYKCLLCGGCGVLKITIIQWTKRSLQVCLAPAGRLLEGFLIGTSNGESLSGWRGKFRRAVEWDPVGIAFRIVCIQIAWIAGLLLWGKILGINAIFSSGDDMKTCLALIANCPFRSKMVADYVVTMLILHASAVIIVSGAVPLRPIWWLNVLLVGVLVFSISRQLCIRHELEPIPIGDPNTNIV